jgi:hypothetical protein
MSGNFTIEVYEDSDYQKRIFERFFDVPSSSWGTWELNKMPAWHMPSISYDDIGANLPDNLFVRAIFRPTDTPEREFTDKTLVL